MKMERYVRFVTGAYYWKPTKVMREAGFFNEPLGKDPVAANARARILNAEWDAIKAGREAKQILQNGTFGWLFSEFQKDPTWYGKLGSRTKERYDLVIKRLSETLSDIPVRTLNRAQVRAIYNNYRLEGSVNVGRDTIKCLKRILRYAIERGQREDNPADGLMMEDPPPRQAVWRPEEVEAVIGAALIGGKADSGNEIPPRPSVALATAIAYEIGQQKCDVLSLRWEQWDGEGFTLRQQKKRGDRLMYLPVLSKETREMIEAAERSSPYVIVDEITGTPYVDDLNSTKRSRQTAFSRIFKRFRIRAGIERDLTFADLRRTALTELGNSGATDTEIVSISGHKHGTQVLSRYVVADKATAIRTAQKRWQK